MLPSPCTPIRVFTVVSSRHGTVWLGSRLFCSGTLENSALFVGQYCGAPPRLKCTKTSQVMEMRSPYIIKKQPMCKSTPRQALQRGRKTSNGFQKREFQLPIHFCSSLRQNLFDEEQLSSSMQPLPRHEFTVTLQQLVLFVDRYYQYPEEVGENRMFDESR